MVLGICVTLILLTAAVLTLIPRDREGRRAAAKLWGSLAALGVAISFGTTFLVAMQGDPYSELELISSKKIEDVGYSESSTRRGNLIGNYTYRVAQEDGDGDRFLVSESVPSASTRLYIEEDLDGGRLEKYQGYWYEPEIFPWRFWSHQPYRLYSSEDPR